ncbi:Noc2-domain-containing protein [Lactifluus volemus]|nr:Noc2-domain-containing protein [Lactifluus volemus]
MAKRGTKATRKFAASGQLTKKIQARRKHQQIQRNVHKKKGAKANKGRPERVAHVDRESEEDEQNKASSTKKSLKGMSVDDFLGASFMEDEVEESGGEGSDFSDNDEHDDDLHDHDDASFASVDELEDEGETHMLELSKLAEKDPEFYKYLQDHDRELLEFSMDVVNDDDHVDDTDDAGESDGDQLPTLTENILRTWQKSLLETRSLRALRKLLVAFRSAVFMNEDDKVLAWTIDSPTVYDKLVRTALRYTPVVLDHHVPTKLCQTDVFIHHLLTRRRSKAPTQTQKLKTLQKLIVSFFHNIIHITSQLSDPELLKLAITESAKVLPYVTSSRKTVKRYLKACLDLWSTADDSVRMVTILAIHKLASAPDESILDLVLKSTYQTLVKSSKNTNSHSLPSITFMKNSASEIFCLNQQATYQHAFGFIRQLAIHLRSSMKLKTKDSYKQVYNWQYVHAVDFWSLVLARACENQGGADDRKKEGLQLLIYPLVQVATGAITLTSTKSKASTLRPLDFETNLRAPQQYVKTRVYAENVAQEAAFLITEWLSVRVVHASIAFPDLVVPIVASLRRALKTAHGGPKVSGTTKALVERIEESARWIAQRRAGVTFAPANTDAVGVWEGEVQLEDAPLFKYARVLRKTRERQRKLVEKARSGEDEMVEE